MPVNRLWQNSRTWRQITMLLKAWWRRVDHDGRRRLERDELRVERMVLVDRPSRLGRRPALLE